MGYLLPGLRAREMASVAAEHGMEYLEREAAGITDQAFSLFMQSDGRRAENLLVWRRHGREVYGFDFPFLAGQRPEREFLPAGFPTLAFESGIQYAAVIVSTEGRIPMLHVSARGRRGFLPAGVETPFRAGTKAFTKMFRLWAEEPDFLPRLLTPEVQELLVRTDERLMFELHMDAVLCVARKLKPTDFPPLMILTSSLVDAISPSVWEDFPRDPSPLTSPPDAPAGAAPARPAVPEGWTEF